jgi:hypothetical protein
MASQTGIIQQRLQGIVIPRVVKIRQDFERPVVHDLDSCENHSSKKYFSAVWLTFGATRTKLSI